MSRREPWIIKVMDPRVKRWSATWRLAQVVGPKTAARWAHEARTLRPGALRRKVRQEHQN